MNRFGSVLFGNNYVLGSMRCGLRFSDASWLGSVRFVRFGSVSNSFLQRNAGNVRKVKKNNRIEESPWRKIKPCETLDMRDEGDTVGFLPPTI